MNILRKLTKRLDDKIANVGIGLSDTEYHSNKILYATIKFLGEFKTNSFIKVHFYGNPKVIQKISENTSYSKYQDKINLIECEHPIDEIFQSLQEYKINRLIRGSLSSSSFLEKVKEIFNNKIVNRLALLETNSGYQFFFGPVGIDECNDFKSKKEFIRKAIDQLEKMRIEPNISVLSGGRTGDLGRDPYVDQTIEEAEDLVRYFQENNPDITINHHQILIEKAIEEKANLIIAPNGISGNLIYRTLVHLGSGKAYGALYLGLNKLLIDTSRVGNLNEIYGALVLSLALD